MSSAQSPISSSEKITTITDLPPELVTSIYKHMDNPSSVTTFNSTSRKHHLIWQSNAASISSTAIYDNIPSFSLALELLEIQEKVRGVDFTTSHPPTERLREIQQEARDVVLKYQTEGYRGVSLSNGDYNATLVQNQALVSIAKKASHVGGLHTKGLLPNAVLSPQDTKMSCENVIAAFYRVWTLATLRLGQAIQERVDSIDRDDLKDMMVVVQSLVVDCSDEDKVYLGMAQPGIMPGSGCQLDASWMKAILEISQAYGGAAGLIMTNEMRGNPMRMQVKWRKAPGHASS